MIPDPDAEWLSPQELVAEGFRQSRVVMMNEAHDYPRRCIRTRLVGRSVLRSAREGGADLLAMEALGPPGQAERGHNVFLQQSEMVAMIEEATKLGFDLRGYEADPETAPAAYLAGLDTGDHWAFTNWREDQQAANLAANLAALLDASQGRILVWCGNGHLTKRRLTMTEPAFDWQPMGWRFIQRSGCDPFAIDQTASVAFRPDRQPRMAAETTHRALLERHGGSAGALLSEEIAEARGVNAVILSLENDLE